MSRFMEFASSVIDGIDYSREFVVTDEHYIVGEDELKSIMKEFYKRVEDPIKASKSEKYDAMVETLSHRDGWSDNEIHTMANDAVDGLTIIVTLW